MTIKKRTAPALLLGALMLVVSLAACGSSKVVNEYNDYVGQIGKLAADEEEIMDEYSSVTGDNYVDDYTLYDALNDTIIPQTKKFVEKLEEVTCANSDLKDIHEIYISAWQAQQGAFTIMLAALENQDFAQITDANDRLDKARKSVRDYLQALEDFRSKNKIVLAK